MPKAHLLDLSSEIIQHINEYFDPCSRFECGRTCTVLRECIAQYMRRRNEKIYVYFVHAGHHKNFARMEAHVYTHHKKTYRILYDYDGTEHPQKYIHRCTYEGGMTWYIGDTYSVSDLGAYLHNSLRGCYIYKLNDISCPEMTAEESHDIYYDSQNSILLSNGACNYYYICTKVDKVTVTKNTIEYTRKGHVRTITGYNKFLGIDCNYDDYDEIYTYIDDERWHVIEYNGSNITGVYACVEHEKI